VLSKRAEGVRQVLVERQFNFFRLFQCSPSEPRG